MNRGEKISGRPHIGFFGCGEASELVSVAPPNGWTKDVTSLRRMKVATWRIDPCPKCGGVHVTKPLWRVVRTTRERGEHKLTVADRVSDGGKLARERRTARLASGSKT